MPPFLELLKIGDNWYTTAFFYAALLVIALVVIRKWTRLSKFSGEVFGELKKASWPWESDPKLKGLKKYKELVDSTIVVIIAMLLLAGFVQFWDFLHVAIVGELHKLGR